MVPACRQSNFRNIEVYMLRKRVKAQYQVAEYHRNEFGPKARALVQDQRLTGIMDRFVGVSELEAVGKTGEEEDEEEEKEEEEDGEEEEEEDDGAEEKNDDDAVDEAVGPSPLAVR